MKIKLFLLLLIFAVLPAAAQRTGLRGAVVDATGAPVPGATVLLTSQGISATTGPGGDFLISNAAPGTQTVNIIAYGFEDFVKDITFVSGVIEDLGTIKLTSEDEDSNSYDTAVIIDQNQLEDEEGNDQSIGMLSGASDNVYYSAANYDFSATRFRIRGYDSEYSQTYINGVHFTDAIRGRFSYSMLGGMNQAFKSRSVSTGLNTSAFSLGEIGGATSINSTASAFAPGFRGSLAYTNGSYAYRGMITYATGVRKNGWAFALSAIGRYSKEGIVEGTFYHSGGLFLSLEKQFNSRHSLNITAFGAPTERATNSATFEEAYQLADSYLYNPNWGWYQGEKRSAKIVESFDPTVIVNWIWKPKSGSQINTAAAFKSSFYSSSALNWYNVSDPRPDYYRYLPSYFDDKPEAYEYYKNLWENNVSQRQLDWNRLYNVNSLALLESEQMGTEYRGSSYILEDRHSDMKNFILNSTLNHRLNDHMTLQAGIGVNWSRASYYKTMRDLLGGCYWMDTDQYSERDFPDNPDMLQNDLNNPDRKIYEGDRFGYDYDINSFIAEAWLQNIVNLAHWDFNYGLKLTYTQFQRDGKMRNGRAPENSYGKGKSHSFDNGMVKVGGTYKPNGKNFITLNVSYGTRAPYANNVYISPRIKDTAIDYTNERDLAADLTYTFNYRKFHGSISGYWTNFYDAIERSSFYDDGLSTFVNYALTGINKTHKGVELGVAYKVTSDLTITAAGSISKYQYKNRPTAFRSAENGAIEDRTDVVYLKNFYLPNGPQTVGSLSVNYNAPHMWFLELNGSWTGDSYIQVTPLRHMYIEGMLGCDSKDKYIEKVKEISHQDKLRDAFTLNVSIGKLIYVNRKMSLNFNVSVNNILNKKNIQTGGYQQNRFDYTDYDVNKYANKYYYTQGIRVFANVGIKF